MPDGIIAPRLGSPLPHPLCLRCGSPKLNYEVRDDLQRLAGTKPPRVGAPLKDLVAVLLAQFRLVQHVLSGRLSDRREKERTA